jgi:hypothetical protein
MSEEDKKFSISNDVTPVPRDLPRDAKGIQEVRRADNILLAKLGYRSEFRREFSVSLCSTTHGHLIPTRNKLIETVAFSFSIMGVVASVTSTFSFPLVAGNCYPTLLALYNQIRYFHKVVMSE